MIDVQHNLQKQKSKTLDQRPCCLVCVWVDINQRELSQSAHTHARRGAVPGRGKAEKGPAVYLWWQWFPAWGKINAGTLKQSKHPALNKVQTIASILFAIKGKLNLGCCLATFYSQCWLEKLESTGVHKRWKHRTRLLSLKAALIALAWAVVQTPGLTSTPCTLSFMWSSRVVFPSFLFFQQ